MVIMGRRAGCARCAAHAAAAAGRAHCMSLLQLYLHLLCGVRVSLTPFRRLRVCKAGYSLARIGASAAGVILL